MRHCPVCQTRYDEDVVRFCMKDGAPLVEDNPTFSAMPSQSSIEDFDGEETIIRRNHPQNASSEQNEDFSPSSSSSSQRIVIPTNEDPKDVVRAKTQPGLRQEPPKSNTAVIVLLTIIGTFAIIGGLIGIWYVLRSSGNSSKDSNTNKSNTNFNGAPVNTGGFNTNYNADNSLANLNPNSNVNLNANSNANANANLKTPTPTRTPTPTPTPANTNTNQNTNISLGNTNVMSRPTPSPTPTLTPTPAPPTPKPTPSPSAPPQNVNVGVMNSRATSLTTPAYPQSARQANASGQVTVQISVDEQGNVTSARAVSGNPLLRPSAEAAARQSRFNPVRVGDRAISATGVLVYNFIGQ